MSIKKKAQYLGEGVNWLKGHGQMIPDYFGNLMRRIGGGERAVVRARQASPELIASRNSQRGAEMSHNLAAQRYKEAQQAESKLLNSTKNWKQPNSKRNVKRVNDAARKTDEAERNAITASQKSMEAKEAFNNTKRQVTNDALRQVRNKGIKRTLKTTGLVGGLSTGAYLVIPRNSKSPSAAEETPQQYMYNPNNGWQKWNQETGQYENQQQGFGIDRYGNTNYYDGTNWLTPDQYLQGSNGYIYNKQTGQIIGTADDTMEAHNSGYDSVFDYRAAKAGYNSPEAVKQLQEKLGINADGKWGQQTQDAFNKTVSNWAQQYDPNSLFSIYQRKMQFGY